MWLLAEVFRLWGVDGDGDDGGEEGEGCGRVG